VGGSAAAVASRRAAAGSGSPSTTARRGLLLLWLAVFTALLVALFTAFGRRAVVLGLPLPAAARRDATAAALPPTAYLTVEAVGSLRLPLSQAPAQPQ
jgi:hypothetical protein